MKKLHLAPFAEPTGEIRYALFNDRGNLVERISEHEVPESHEEAQAFIERRGFTDAAGYQLDPDWKREELQKLRRRRSFDEADFAGAPVRDTRHPFFRMEAARRVLGHITALDFDTLRRIEGIEAVDSFGLVPRNATFAAYKEAVEAAVKAEHESWQWDMPACVYPAVDVDANTARHVTSTGNTLLVIEFTGFLIFRNQQHDAGPLDPRKERDAGLLALAGGKTCKALAHRALADHLPEDVLNDVLNSCVDAD